MNSAVASVENAVKVLTIGHSTGRSTVSSRRFAKTASGASSISAQSRALGTIRNSTERNWPRHCLRPALPYEHRPGLGGLRHPRKDSPNSGWRNAGFRGFADYMQTPPFAEEIKALIREARRDHVCRSRAEALPPLSRGRRAQRPRRRGRAHHECRSPRTAQADPVRTGRRHATHLSAGRARAFLSARSGCCSPD